MVTTQQQFVFEDGSFSNLPGLIFSSRYTTLALAVADAVGLKGILVIDQDWPSIDNIAIDCDVMAGGGVISWITNGTSTNSIVVSGNILGESQIFDVTTWLGDPRLTGLITARVPMSPFPVVLLAATAVNVAWFGACNAASNADTRLAIQAAFCAVGNGTFGQTGSTPPGYTVRFPAGYTYAFERNGMYDGTATPALPYGVLLPEQRTITVEADGAIFDYQGVEYRPSPPTPSGLGTAAFAWYVNELAVTFFRSGLEWHGGLVMPTMASGNNSDFIWVNNQNGRFTVRDLQIGHDAPAMTTIGHRNGIVQCQWDSSQNLTGQRIVLDNCDVSYCTDTGVIIVQCDGLLVSGCRIRDNLGSGVELGCAGLRGYNGVAQFGTCSGAKILAGNYEGNAKSGVKCIDARNTYVSADFESNALGMTTSDANMDFSGLFDLTPGTGNSTAGSMTIAGLSFDPVARGWLPGMVVKDKQGKMGTVNTIGSRTTSSLTMTSAVPTTNTGLVLSAFLGTGDREGLAQACTWNNSHTLDAYNVITQASTVLDENLHDGTTVHEIGVLHLSASQPLWCTKEVFTLTSAMPTFFSPNCWSGGVVTRESATTFSLPSNTTIGGNSIFQLTPSFSLDTTSVMVEAGGLVKIGTGFSTSYRITLYDVTSTPTVVQTLTTGTAAWEEGTYQSQRVGARLNHLTQATVSGWSTGKLYAIYATNTVTGSGSFIGGVVVRFCTIVPPT
jgi:hypothetical protein